MRSRSDPDRDVKLSWAHTVTLKHTDINFRVMDSVAKLTHAVVFQAKILISLLWECYSRLIPIKLEGDPLTLRIAF